MGQIWTHVRHPIPRPHWWTMGCLFWVFWRILTVWFKHCIVFGEPPYCVVAHFSTCWAGHRCPWAVSVAGTADGSVAHHGTTLSSWLLGRHGGSGDGHLRGKRQTMSKYEWIWCVCLFKKSMTLTCYHHRTHKRHSIPGANACPLMCRGWVFWKNMVLR